MKVLLTGVTGYIAQRLLPVLLQNGHEVICCVRDKRRFTNNYTSAKITVVEADFVQKETLRNIPDDIEVAYYFINSMSTHYGNSDYIERLCAVNFKERIQKTNVKQVIYLSGIVDERKMTKHLLSRKTIDAILSSSTFALTNLRVRIIIGSGSSSFEIIRDLVEKQPVMIGPRWLNTKCRPIAIHDVVEYLVRVIGVSETYNKTYDIIGPDTLDFKEMLSHFAKIRGLKRRIFVLPLMIPRISTYWLYFLTSTSYALARNLISQLKTDITPKPNNLASLLNISLIDYDTSIKRAFDAIEHNKVLSSWKDAQTSNIFNEGISNYTDIPDNGCFKDIKKIKISNDEYVLDRIWKIGGSTGWYYGNWLWSIRGLIDQLKGGVGMRRGRKSDKDIHIGETLDFWRVIVADKEEKRLLLYAEMKLPGEAWLEFKIDNENILTQTATFRPLGLKGRLYWYSMLPFHFFIFQGMLKNIVKVKANK